MHDLLTPPGAGWLKRMLRIGLILPIGRFYREVVSCLGFQYENHAQNQATISIVHTEPREGMDPRLRELTPALRAQGNATYGLSFRGTLYRVTLVVEYLGWVDVDLGCTTILLRQ